MASQKINASLAQNQPNGVQILVSVTPDPRNSASIGNTVDKNMFVDIDLGSNYQGNINNAASSNNATTYIAGLDRGSELGYYVTIDGRLFDNNDSEYDAYPHNIDTALFKSLVTTAGGTLDGKYDVQVVNLNQSNAGTFVVNFGRLPSEVSR